MCVCVGFYLADAPLAGTPLNALGNPLKRGDSQGAARITPLHLSHLQTSSGLPFVEPRLRFDLKGPLLSAALSPVSAPETSTAPSSSVVGLRRGLPRLPKRAVDNWPVQFTSHADDYAAIWLQGALFTLFTLGLGLPWARLRCRRHLLQHTQLGGQALDDHASPWAMLVRQLLVVALLAGGALAAAGDPWAGLAGFTIAVLSWPLLWLAAVSHRINRLSWGRRPLAWQGRITEAWRAAAAPSGWCLVGVWLGAAWLTLGRPWSLPWPAGGVAWAVLGLLLWPEGAWRLALLRQAGARLGPLRLRWQARRAEVRRACLTQLMQAVWLGAAVAGIALVLMAAAQAVFPAWGRVGSMVTAVAAALVWALVSWWQWQARLFRLVWDQTGNRSMRFRCTLPVSAMLGEHVLHACLVVGTAGIYWPWAQHRAWASRARATTLRSRVALHSVMRHWPARQARVEVVRERVDR